VGEGGGGYAYGGPRNLIGADASWKKEDIKSRNSEIPTLSTASGGPGLY